MVLKSVPKAQELGFREEEEEKEEAVGPKTGPQMKSK